MGTMVLLTLLVSGSGAQQPVANATGAFFALSVPDLEASAKWYSEKLGLAATMQGTPSGDTPGFVVLEGGSLIVELINRRGSVHPSANAPELRQGFTKAGAIVADFDDVVARLRKNGVAIVI